MNEQANELGRIGHLIDAENIALELEKLRILKERELGLRVRETESGDILVEEGEY